MEFFTYRLPNGIRGIHRQVKSNVAHCALVINAGSRDEHPDQYGLAHLTEHAFFKGTQRRRAWQVNCRLENLGGELNAFTTKEDTTIHATTLRGDFPRAAELIADVAFRSTFPERELEREKEVIADEINTYKDSPADLIYDTFEDMLFAGSELGHNILGRKNALARYDGEAIRAFTGRTHTTDQMVFSSIGNFSAKTAEAVAARYFAGQAASARGFGRVAPAPCAAFEKTVVKHTHQTHCIIGNRAYGIGEEKRLPLALLINILGGPCANSLLNVVVREKNGLSYNIEASYTPYSDSGIVAIYFSSENGNTAQCIDLIEGELHRLRTTPLTARQLSMAKKQFIAQLAISSESNEGYMLGAGKSFLTHDDVDTMEQVYAKVRALTAAQLTEVAEEVFSGMSRLIYKERYGKGDRIRPARRFRRLGGGIPRPGAAGGHDAGTPGILRREIHDTRRPSRPVDRRVAGRGRLRRLGAARSVRRADPRRGYAVAVGGGATDRAARGRGAGTRDRRRRHLQCRVVHGRTRLPERCPAHGQHPRNAAKVGRGELHGRGALRGAPGRARRQRRNGQRHRTTGIHPRVPARPLGRHPRGHRSVVQVQQGGILRQIMDALEQYIHDHTSPEEELLHELDRATNLRVVQPRMLSGHIQGRLLEMLVRMLRPQRILEIGTFTGYSALSMAAGLEEGGELHTIEVEDELEELAQSFFDRSPHGAKIRLHIGSALDIAPALGMEFDLVFIDGDKREYPDYYRMLMGDGGTAPLVHSGSVLVADNILWSGKVVQPIARSDRHTQAVVEFNRMVSEDPRVENVIIPLRDGLNLIRVK